MIPIGRASTAGNLTFKSTATIVAKEGISMGAGAGAQKLTTDVTGNDTAGMSVDEHSNTLKTLDEVFEGNRLDYDNTAFKIRSGVDGVSKSVGNADTVYGKITYILDDVDGIKVPTDFPIEDNFPYTGRGFTGSKNIVLPELVQDMRPFVDGDILGIYDAKTGVLTQQFVYDSDLGWLLK